MLEFYFSYALSEKDYNTLWSLLTSTEHVRQRTSQTRRIQRGSPGAGALGSDMWQLQNEVDGIKPKVEEILKPGRPASSNEQLPYLSLLCDHFQEFVKVLHQPFNDAGSEPGYYERVQYLETLMYVTGTLRGSLQLFLEQSKSSTLDTKRRLVFEDAEVITSGLNQLHTPAVEINVGKSSATLIRPMGPLALSQPLPRATPALTGQPSLHAVEVITSGMDQLQLNLNSPFGRAVQTQRSIFNSTLPKPAQPPPLTGSSPQPQPLTFPSSQPQPLAFPSAQLQPLPRSPAQPQPLPWSPAQPQPLPRSPAEPQPLTFSSAQPQVLTSFLSAQLLPSSAQPQPLKYSPAQPQIFSSSQPQPLTFPSAQPQALTSFSAAQPQPLSAQPQPLTFSPAQPQPSQPQPLTLDHAASCSPALTNVDNGNNDDSDEEDDEVYAELKAHSEAMKKHLMAIKKRRSIQQDATRAQGEAVQKQLAELQKQNHVMQVQLKTLLVYFHLD